MAVTSEQIAAGFQVVAAVGATIKELKRVPAGPLYAGLMSRGISLDGFESIVRTLVKSGLVRRNGDVIEWIEDTAPAGWRNTCE